jgi:hypothetical protein
MSTHTIPRVGDRVRNTAPYAERTGTVIGTWSDDPAGLPVLVDVRWDDTDDVHAYEPANLAIVESANA